MKCKVHHHACDCREAAFANLILFAESMACCPCCCGVDECLDDCTIGIDCPQVAAQIKHAREALKGVR
jgi:hypothetical protein